MRADASGQPVVHRPDLAHQCPEPALDVGQAIRARAAYLPEAARQLAHAAAVLSAPLPPEAGAALLRGQPAQWVAPWNCWPDPCGPPCCGSAAGCGSRSPR